MRRIIAIIMATVLMATLLVGCGGKGRNLYDTADLDDYVEMCEYEGIEINKSSQEYNKIYVYFLYDDIRRTQISQENIKNAVSFDNSPETVVEYGDIVNIDYTGYIGETAFENGSDKDALLVIGSGNFIDNFEEQLIGGKPGQTVDVLVTFPQDYSQSDLAGTRAKFVVKINSVAKEPEQIYKAYQYDSQDEYVKLLENRTNKQFLIEYLLKNCKITDYPEDDVEIFYEAVVEQYSFEYGVDLSTSPKETILKNLVYPTMEQYMILYYIFDEQELELLDSTVESQKTANSTLAECYAVYDTVMNYLLDNSKIK